MSINDVNKNEEERIFHTIIREICNEKGIDVKKTVIWLDFTITER